MEDKTGGPAFGHGAENGHCCGATLRDYFAAQALIYCVKLWEDIPDTIYSKAAESAYKYADAMITARKK